MEIRNLKKVAERIKRAIKNKEKIILYGDADLDGVSSVIILKESIKNLGGLSTKVYFPDRESEGYGLNQKALNLFKKEAPALLILLDCGISNFKEIKLAKKLGLKVIVIDHHEVLGKLPDAEIIVDPKQPKDRYPFKNLANTGLVFKLSQALFGKKFSQQLKESFLELTALATIADMMPQTDDNKVFIEEGLNSLKKTFRPGLKVFQEIDDDLKYRSIKEISQRIISALNSSEREKHLNKTYLLLTSGDKKTAKALAEDLLEKSRQKKIRIKDITEQAEKMALKKTSEPIIFEGDESWQLILLGAVASRICQKFKKPTFLFKRQKKESKGAVRTPSNVNGVEAMKNCSKSLKGFGGHPLAGGFTVENKNLEEYKNCLVKYFRERH